MAASSTEKQYYSIPDDVGETLVSLIADNKSEEFSQLLKGQCDEAKRLGIPLRLERGYKMHAKSPFVIKIHLLDYAADLGRDEMLKELVASDNKIAATKVANDAMCRMSAKGHIKCLHVLLAAGTDANVINGAYGTALHVAANNNQVECLNVLLANGANVHAVNEAGETALHLAALNRSIKVVKALLIAGADVNVVAKESGVTCLYHAVYQGPHEIVRELQQAEVDMEAIKYNRIECVTTLLAAGAMLDDMTIKYVKLARQEGWLAPMLEYLLLKKQGLFIRSKHNVYHLSWLRDPLWRRPGYDETQILKEDFEEPACKDEFTLQELAWLIIASNPSLYDAVLKILPPVPVKTNQQKNDVTLIARCISIRQMMV